MSGLFKSEFKPSPASHVVNTPFNSLVICNGLLPLFLFPCHLLAEKKWSRLSCRLHYILDSTDCICMELFRLDCFWFCFCFEICSDEIRRVQGGMFCIL